jgi:hypothetical protein
MQSDLVQQFLGSGVAAQLIQSVSSTHGLNQQQARSAVQATAEGGAEAVKSGGWDLGTLMSGLAGAIGIGGQSKGLPQDLVQKVSAFVVEKTGLSQSIATAVVTMVLPKVIEFAKAQLGGQRPSPAP